VISPAVVSEFAQIPRPRQRQEGSARLVTA
jgi:hypothetical protein